MDPTTRARLLAINERFYREHGGAFDATRQAPWPGFASVLEHLPPTRPLRVLDVGCGNGRFLCALEARLPASELCYLGVDASQTLLGPARERHRGEHARFTRCDFLSPAPAAALPPGPFDLVALFGVLHHVPGDALRTELLAACAKRLGAGGLLALTFWCFDRDPRFARRRIEPAALTPPLSPEQLEPGDHLLGFGGMPDAVRYCHLSDGAERTRLLDALALEEVARFDDDGAALPLNHYALLRAAPIR